MFKQLHILIAVFFIIFITTSCYKPQEYTYKDNIKTKFDTSCQNFIEETIDNVNNKSFNDSTLSIYIHKSFLIGDDTIGVSDLSYRYFVHLSYHGTIYNDDRNFNKFRNNINTVIKLIKIHDIGYKYRCKDFNFEIPKLYDDHFAIIETMDSTKEQQIKTLEYVRNSITNKPCLWHTNILNKDGSSENFYKYINRKHES